MSLSRRALFLSGAAAFATTSFAVRASADTATYVYDALGRLIRVTYSDGTIIVYNYDAAGNRTQVVRTDGSAFTATIQITGAGPVDLRTLANSAGYSGVTDAAITFQVGSAVTISGAPGEPNGGYGIDTGSWPDGKTIALTLEIDGKVYGGGGKGAQGAGENNTLAGAAGIGGDAVYCRHDIDITVNAGGQVCAGGGGGGGGGGWWRQITVEGMPTDSWYNGGGGGGGFPNGPGGPEGPYGGDYGFDVANPGGGGTTSGGGSPGNGGSVPIGRSTGAGASGGAAAASGGNGAASTGTENATHAKLASSPGGAPGYAIRKNGRTATLTNNGTVSGTVG